MNRRITKYIITGFLCMMGAIMFGFPASADTYVDRYTGGGDGSPSTPSGSDSPGSTGCDILAVQGGRIDCTGSSWIFYKHVPGAPVTEMKFPIDYPHIPDSELPTIPAFCGDDSNGKIAGFWHYGRNARGVRGSIQKNGFGFSGYRSLEVNKSGSQYTYTTTPDGWGHFSQHTYSYLNEEFYSKWGTSAANLNRVTFYGGNMDPLSHSLWKNGVKIYEADSFATSLNGSNKDGTRDVLTAYNDLLKESGGRQVGELPTNISAFCWNNKMASGGRYDGAVTVSVNGKIAQNGETITVQSEYSDVTFDHLIKRNNTDFNGQSNNNWQINGDNGSFSGTATFQKSQEGQLISVKKASEQKRLGQGETKRYCSTLTYNDDFSNDGNGTGSAQAQICVYLTRGKNDQNGVFQTDQTCHLEAGGHGLDGCGQKLYTNSRNWSIRHTGQVYSKAGNKIVGANLKDSSSSSGECDVNNVCGDNRYNYPAQVYGINDTCVRSLTPYTEWWFNDGSGWREGPTLGQSGTDLAFDGSRNNKMVKGYNDYQACYGDNVFSTDASSCKTANGGKPCNCYPVHEEIPGYYFGSVCGDGTKPWYSFKGTGLDGATGNWGQENDPSLLLINDTDNDDKVSLSRTSSMVANSTYPWTNTGAGVDSSTGRSWSTVTSTIVRIRRHFPFDNNAAELKADTGLREEASTPRDNMYTLDTTNSNGEFTITFGYEIVRGATINAVDPGAEHYSVQNSWSSYESITADDGSGRTYRINGDYNNTHSYPDFTTSSPGQTSGRKYQTVKGTLYYGQQVIVCGNLKFGDSIRELDDGAEIESWKERRGREVGCIKVIRNKRDCGNVVGSSGRGSEGFEFSHMYGYNVAKIGAINSTLMSNPIYTQWYPDQARTDTPAYTNTEIYARPGDTVQYQIEYCMGANYAHAVHEANGINDGGVDTTMHVDGDSTAATAASTNRVNNDKRSNYLFGDSLSTFDGTKTTPKIFNYIKRNSDGSINEKESIRDGNNIGSKTSPDGVGTIYSCPIGGGTTTGTNNYYQVAGKVKSKDGNYSVSAHNAEEQYIIDGCTSNRTQSLDVGRQMSEKLQWTNMFFSGDIYHANIKADFLSGAYIRVPYNYTAKPFVTTNNSPKGTVQIGGKLTTTPGIAVFPRKNCALADGVNLDGCNTNNSSTATYATVTKPTTVTFKAYINNESRTFQTDSYVVRANTKSNRNGSTAGGTYATANLNGGGTKLDNDYVIDVPNNVNPGDKICVKMTITPADSHNDPTWATVHGASRASAGAEDTSRDTYTYWALREDGTSTATAVSCSTAVKRPTISVEDSNLYSASNITTSVVSRNNYVYNGGNARNAGNLDYYLFGSWSEYGIFGKVTTGSDGSVNISTLGTASGASLGYSQSSYLSSHKTSVTGYNAQPLTVVTYDGGPKNGTYEYNYSRITHNSSQTRIVYEYETKEDGSRYYRLASKTNQTIAPSSYTFANSPIVNAADSRGVASKATKVCTHSTQTFANVDCDDGKIGSDKIGADAVDVFTTNILDRYGDAKMPYTKTDGAEDINGYTNLTETSAAAEQLDGDEGAAMFKNIKGKAFLGYKDGHAVDYDSLAVKNNGNVEGADTNLTAKSVMVYKADTVVINSSLIANNDEKTGSGDFRMPIIIANKVWFTGNPTRVDAIIIAKEELNTCKWNSYNDFLNNVLPSFPTKKDGLASNKANEMSSNICNNELRFTAPVVVKGKVIFNRTYGAGGADGGGDQIRRAEIFELNAATYLWSFAEMSRYSQAITTYSRELPSRY